MQVWLHLQLSEFLVIGSLATLRNRGHGTSLAERVFRVSKTSRLSGTNSDMVGLLCFFSTVLGIAKIR